jgi:hypothetical protein
MIRILLTGSRMWHDVPLLTDSLDAAAAGHDQVTLIHGRCDPRTTNAGYIAKRGTDRVPWDMALAHAEYGPYVGADWHAHHHAVARGWKIGEYPANWFLYGNSAGLIRNQRMVDLRPIANVCVAAPLGKSPGTRDCMARARKAGIRVVDVTEPPEAEGLW